MSAEDVETIPVFSMTGALSPLLVVPTVIPVFLALFGPIDIISMFPSAAHLPAFIQKLVPFNIRAHADSTRFPQLALMVHSFTILVLPFLSAVWFWQGMKNYPRLLKNQRVLRTFTVKQHFSNLLLGLPLFIGMIYVSIGLPGDPSSAKGFTTQNRFGLAFASLICTYSSAW